MLQYIDNGFDKNLRLGDIIGGFSHIMPIFEDFFNSAHEFKLDIKDQLFFAVLTPCCSIEDNIITLVPLKQINYNLFINPYYAEDFTRINRPVSPEKCYPPKVWTDFTEEKRAQEIEKGEGFVLFQNYFYSPNEKLPSYELKYKNNEAKIVNTYMIDFKEAFTITSKKIQRGNTYPKILQLTTKSRGELREKLAFFYGRIPEEDNV